MIVARWLLLGVLAVHTLLVSVTPLVPSHVEERPAPTVLSENASSTWPTGIRFEATFATNDQTWRAELMYRVAGNETLNLATPLISMSPSGMRVTYDLDMLLALEPPGVEIQYWWRLTSGEMEVETEPNVITWMDDRFAWRLYEAHPIQLFSYSGDEAFDQDILAEARSVTNDLSDWYGLDESAPIRLWIYRSKSDFDGALAPNTESFIAGAAYPDKLLILAVIPPGSGSELRRVVPHEISHQILSQATQNPFNRPPVWFDEGLAVHSQLTGTAGFGETVRDAHARDVLPRLASLNRAFPFDGADARLAYAQSSSVITYLRETYGDDIIPELISAMRSGASSDEVFQDTLGFTIDELDDNWRDWLTGD